MLFFCITSLLLNVQIWKQNFVWLLAHRDTALGVKADVDGLLEGFRSAEDTFSNLEDKLQNATALIEDLNKTLVKVVSMDDTVAHLL